MFTVEALGNQRSLLSFKLSGLVFRYLLYIVSVLSKLSQDLINLQLICFLSVLAALPEEEGNSGRHHAGPQQSPGEGISVCCVWTVSDVIVSCLSTRATICISFFVIIFSLLIIIIWCLKV
jgi:hypothetical protein